MEGAEREGEGGEGGHGGEQGWRQFGGGGDHGEHRSKATARGRSKGGRLGMCRGQAALGVRVRGRGRRAAVPVAVLGQQQRVRPVRGVSEGAPPGKVPEARVPATRRFPLGGVVVKMRYQSDSKRVGGIEPFDDAQVAGDLCQAFPEPQTPIVHGQGVRVEVAWGREQKKNR